MPEIVVFGTLILICLGQIWTIFRSRLAAATYYCCVAPLGYFAVWKFGTWAPDRLCGILLLCAGIFLYRSKGGLPRFTRHPFYFFLVFITFVTLVSSFFWPIEAVSGKSMVYTALRGAIQIANYFIMAGAAWQVAIAFSRPGGFERARRLMIWMAVIHSVYASYQTAASLSGLPVTGIRRPYSEVTADADAEQSAGFHVGSGETITFRACSLVGEPKHLGAFLLLWLGMAITLAMEGSRSIWLMAAILLLLTALVLTFSTSAWAGAIGLTLLGLWALQSRSRARIVAVILPALLLVAGVVVADSLALLPEEYGGRGNFLTLLRERTTEREILTDVAEVEAQRILRSNPIMVLSGAGLGGMSFFIADALGHSDVILFPNTGLLAYICDFGAVGLVLMLFSLRRGLLPMLRQPLWADQRAASLSFIGTVCLMQSFIFSGGILTFALIFLFAAEFQRAQLRARAACPQDLLSMFAMPERRLDNECDGARRSIVV